MGASRRGCGHGLLRGGFPIHHSFGAPALTPQSGRDMRPTCEAISPPRSRTAAVKPRTGPTIQLVGRPARRRAAGSAGGGPKRNPSTWSQRDHFRVVALPNQHVRTDGTRIDELLQRRPGDRAADLAVRRVEPGGCATPRLWRSRDQDGRVQVALEHLRQPLGVGPMHPIGRDHVEACQPMRAAHLPELGHAEGPSDSVSFPDEIRLVVHASPPGIYGRTLSVPDYSGKPDGLRPTPGPPAAGGEVEIHWP